MQLVQHTRQDTQHCYETHVTQGHAHKHALNCHSIASAPNHPPPHLKPHSSPPHLHSSPPHLHSSPPHLTPPLLTYTPHIPLFMYTPHTPLLTSHTSHFINHLPHSHLGVPGDGVLDGLVVLRSDSESLGVHLHQVKIFEGWALLGTLFRGRLALVRGTLCRHRNQRPYYLYTYSVWGGAYPDIVSSPDPSRANAGRKGLVTLGRMLCHNGMQIWAYCIIACSPCELTIRIITAAEIAVHISLIPKRSSLI